MRHILILFLAAALTSACANTSKAEEYAGQYAADFFPEHVVNQIACERSDSDGDGRVRCNISLTNNSGFRQVEAVECPSNWTPQPFKTMCVGIKGRSR